MRGPHDLEACIKSQKRIMETRAIDQAEVMIGLGLKKNEMTERLT